MEPEPKSPPPEAVPYRVLLERTKRLPGNPPSLPLVKLCRLTRPVPSRFRRNTEPAPKLAPTDVVPYRVLPERSNPAVGLAPDWAVKFCSVVKVCAGK